MCVAALVGYLAFPTYPTYDSFYALLWGRDLLHAHLPDFQVYRAPTEHPLAIAFGMLCSVFGQGGARLMVLGSIASFVAAVAGIYRVGRLSFGPLVGAVAALLLLSRFFVENLAAQGYLDISYLALILWALALELERRRRGPAVFVLLAAAGPAAPRRLGAERRVLAVVLLAGAAAGRARRPGLAAATAEPARRMLAYLAPGGERAAAVGRLRRDRDRQPAVLADGDRRAGPGTGTHAGLLGGARVGVELQRADRPAAGPAGRDRRGCARGRADAAAGAACRSSRSCCCTRCTCSRAPAGRR